MPATSSWTTKLRISRVKVLVAAALAALTLSLGLQAAKPAPASAMMNITMCANLSIIYDAFYNEGFFDAAKAIGRRIAVECNQEWVPDEVV